MSWNWNALIMLVVPCAVALWCLLGIYAGRDQ